MEGDRPRNEEGRENLPQAHVIELSIPSSRDDWEHHQREADGTLDQVPLRSIHQRTPRDSIHNLPHEHEEDEDKELRCRDQFHGIPPLRLSSLRVSGSPGTVLGNEARFKRSGSPLSFSGSRGSAPPHPPLSLIAAYGGAIVRALTVQAISLHPMRLPMTKGTGSHGGLPPRGKLHLLAPRRASARGVEWPWSVHSSRGRGASRGLRPDMRSHSS